MDPSDPPSQGPEKPRVIHIDTDPGLDDLLALGLALASPELQIAGITTVAGNASLEAVTRNAAGFLALAGANLPLGSGKARPLGPSVARAEHIHGEDGRAGLDLPQGVEPRESALEIFRRSVECEAIDTLLTLGPLTNVAHWLEREPGLFGKLRVVWMGGTRGRGNVSAVAEFNAYADPQALAVILAAEVPISIVGLEVTTQVRVAPAPAGEQAFGAGRLGRFLDAAISALALAERATGGDAFATLHDPCAVAALLVAQEFRFEECSLTVAVTEGPERGRLTIDPMARTAQHRYATRVNAKAIEDLIIGRLAALAERSARADG